MKKIFSTAFAVFTFFVFNICLVAGYYSLSLPDSFYVEKGTPLTLSTNFEIKAEYENSVSSFAGDASSAIHTANLELFGLIPVKEVEVQAVQTPYLVPGGTPFGIKLLMDGVMVVGMGEVRTLSGSCCPATECGLEEGDVILSLDGVKISSNSDINRIVSASNGNPLEIVYTDGKEETVSFLTPVYSIADCCYKAGIWVRDSTAGIGTVTFYEPETGRFGGLGHPVCDSDTGELIPISSGEAAQVEITSINRGLKGQPGELRGCFTRREPTGVINTNNKYGVFGELFSEIPEAEPIPMGLKQDIKEGSARILSTVDEGGVESYDIEIEEIDYKNTGTKNMTIRITDKELLEKTGGIVQGMSGSPIIQNGKLIGAVTHVFVSDPKMGYAIFAENMYESGFVS
ncbi:MAG: SpoIVB peptidase [Oscillospiraceae bacterium]|nr:SpoIVB peptidase [Oscillospiraceae bacterium]